MWGTAAAEVHVVDECSSAIAAAGDRWPLKLELSTWTSATEIFQMALSTFCSQPPPAKRTLSSWSTFELIPRNCRPLLESAVKKLIQRGR